MMKPKALLLLFLAALFNIGPIMGQETSTQEQIKKLPHITAAQALYLFRQDKIMLLDVHEGSDRSMIIGAYYLPAKKLPNVRLKIPKSRLIGVFCD